MSSILALCLIITFTFNNYAYASGEPNLSSCTNVTTTGMEYSTTFPITDKQRVGNNTFLSFYVKTSAHAYVILSAKSEPPISGELTFEIGLGISRNGSACAFIRIKRIVSERTFLCDTSELNLSEWHHFWIRVSPTGFIQIGEGHKNPPILTRQARQSIEIHHFGFASWQNTAYWALNCNEQSLKSAIYSLNETPVERNSSTRMFK